MNLINRFRFIIKDKDFKKVLSDIFSLYFLKFLTMFVSFLITPLYITFFYSNNLLGFWFTAIATFNWLMLFDIGLSSGIRNKIVESYEKKDFNEIRIIISNSFFSIGFLVGFLILGSVFLVIFYDWYKFFGLNYDEITKTSFDIIILVFLIGVALRFFSVLISQILYSIHRPFLPNFMIFISNIMILIYVIVNKNAINENDLVNFALFSSFANNFPALVMYFIIFYLFIPKSKPNLISISLKKIKNLFADGTNIFFIQILMALLFNLRELFISWFVQPAQVIEYQIFLKSIGFVSSIVILGFSPLWATINRAFVNRNFKLIKSLYLNGRIIILIITFLQLPLLILLPFFLRFWVPTYPINDLEIKGLLYIFSSTFLLLSNFNLSFYLGLKLEKRLLVYLIFTSLFYLLLIFLGSSFFDSWIYVVLVSSISSILISKKINLSTLKT